LLAIARLDNMSGDDLGRQVVREMVAGDIDTPRLGARWRGRDLLILAVKTTVTAGCFWYIFRQIQPDRFVRSVMALQLGWVAVALLAALTQVLLVAVRWSAIVNALSAAGRKISVATAFAITMTGAFLGLVLPYVAGDAARAWLLVQHGRDWRTSLLSVVIDRAVGAGMLCALGFVILLFPQAALSLGAHRAPALQAFGAMLAIGVIGLLAAPWLASVLERWRLTRWISAVALAAHHAVLGSRKALLILSATLAVHALSMLAIWVLGRAQGISLAPIDVAILFVVMIAATIFPLSVGGWGVREVAAIGFLSARGVPVEQALFLSLSFGVVGILATLPGAALWFLVRPASDRPAPG
jgi:glycosyltransferase 2 family protein